MEVRRRRRRWWRLLPILIPILGASLWSASESTAYVANLRMYSISSASMAPTLAMGDRIAVDRRGGSPARGEIWTFAMPGGATHVKRAIGLPGESIRVAGGKVFIDDRPLDEPYLAAPMTYTLPTVRLGPGEYFLLGDVRDASLDSHVTGPVLQGQLIGRAEHRFRPGRGFARLR